MMADRLPSVSPAAFSRRAVVDPDRAVLTIVDVQTGAVLRRCYTRADLVDYLDSSPVDLAVLTDGELIRRVCVDRDGPIRVVELVRGDVPPRSPDPARALTHLPNGRHLPKVAP